MASAIVPTVIRIATGVASNRQAATIQRVLLSCAAARITVRKLDTAVLPVGSVRANPHLVGRSVFQTGKAAPKCRYSQGRASLVTILTNRSWGP
eukprot:9478340-Pyramimonas_sp.AAC.3